MFSPLSVLHAGSSGQIKELVSNYVQETFNVSNTDIQLEFIHLPDIEIPFGNSNRLVIESDHISPKLGYQTLWLKIYDGNYLLQKQPVTLKVAIYLDVAVSKRRLKRGESIIHDNVELRRIRINRRYKDLILDLNSIDGLVSKQVIKENCIIRRGMIRNRPEVLRGEDVTIQLKSGLLTLTTSGKSKQDGMIGEEVKVVCNMTGKQIIGTVESPQLVVTRVQ